MQTGFRTDEGVPLPATAGDARAMRRITAAAIAALLQGVFYWLILQEPVEPTALPGPRPLEVTLFETAKRLRRAPSPRKRGRLRSLGQAASRNVPAQAEPVVAQPITLPRAAPHAPLDWRQAMQDEVRAEESQSRARKLRFGFPQQSAPIPAAPEFGWDYAATHRMVPLPSGGILFNLNDRCALVIYGFMLAGGCGSGRIPVHGHLFDHMHDRRKAHPGALP